MLIKVFLYRSEFTNNIHNALFLVVDVTAVVVVVVVSEKPDLFKSDVENFKCQSSLVRF